VILRRILPPNTLAAAICNAADSRAEHPVHAGGRFWNGMHARALRLTLAPFGRRHWESVFKRRKAGAALKTNNSKCSC
jgi:hypothetical protein